MTTPTDSEASTGQAPTPTAPRRPATPLLALTAIVLSLAALGVSVFEVSTIRDEQRIQVWPYVDLVTRFGPEGFQLEARNKGIGPARVRTTRVLLEGRAYEDLDELILNTVGEENAFSYDLYSTTNPARSVMSPDEVVVLFGVPWEPRTRLLAQRWTDRIEVELCYCSVYDDCWLSRLDSAEPEPVPACDDR